MDLWQSRALMPQAIRTRAARQAFFLCEGFAMLHPSHGRSSLPARPPLPDLLLGLPVMLMLATTTRHMLGLADTYLLIAALLYLTAAALIGYAWSTTAPARDFGWANRVTLCRLCLVLLLAALAPFPSVVASYGWALALLCLFTLALDGLDGAVARRTRSCSAFGSRFDMETDALFILALALLLAISGKAGGWVVILGLIRYGFVAAGMAWRWLAHPLPDSFRRKTVCVWQLATLLTCLTPAITPGLATALLALALALLIWSFAVDLGWLCRLNLQRHGGFHENTTHRPAAGRRPARLAFLRRLGRTAHL